MSALAIMLHKQGFFVAGSDETAGRGTEILEKYGIEVDFTLNEENIKKAEVVVFSSAIKEDDIHMKCAISNKKKLMSRGQLLGEISEKYEKVIAVAGSHGKTTTTAMIQKILEAAGKDSTLHLGGYRLEDGLNHHIGEKEYFVTEACEYHNNFLYLHPYISVVTNIEKEHMDFFKTFENEKKSFAEFKKNSRYVVDTFEGIEARDVRHDRFGGLLFSLWRKDCKIMDLHMRICEEVNTQNCIYAYLVAKKLGISDCIIKQGLESFLGVGTRFERMSCPYFDTVFCDYAHHPTELDKAIKTAKKIFKGRKLITIFQPHTYSRTKNLFSEFVTVFQQVKYPIFFKTYSAREKPEEGISALQFSEEMKKHNPDTLYFENYLDLFSYFMEIKEEKPVLLFLGAGDLPAILHKNHFTT